MIYDILQSTFYVVVIVVVILLLSVTSSLTILPKPFTQFPSISKQILYVELVSK